MFSQLSSSQKRTIRLLGIGTFLEYFDLFLYVHMAVLLNDIFFPPVSSSAHTWLASFSFCSSFIFRPLGAWILGYVGDTCGRKLTIVITTLMTGITCFIMAFLPTYAQIGIQATWILVICRMLQGLASLGEIVGAQLFLTEATPLHIRFPVVGLIIVFAVLGTLTAVGVSTVATSYGFNWRIAFMIGTCIAVVGTVARTKLRESPEFADATRRLKGFFKSMKQDPGLVEKNPFYVYSKKVKFLTALAYFLIMCPTPLIIYFVYFYCANTLKNVFNYTSHQVIIHNLLLVTVEFFGWAILRTYLTKFIHPLRILRFSWMMLFLYVPFVPWLLNHITIVWHLFFIQTFILLFRVVDFPATPIFYRSFPVFKRFSYVSTLFALAYALIYAITSFGLAYLVDYFSYWGLLILMVPVLIGYGYGLNHFINLEKAAGRYPKLPTWDEK